MNRRRDATPPPGGTGDTAADVDAGSTPVYPPVDHDGRAWCPRCEELVEPIPADPARDYVWTCPHCGEAVSS